MTLASSRLSRNTPRRSFSTPKVSRAYCTLCRKPNSILSPTPSMHAVLLTLNNHTPAKTPQTPRSNFLAESILKTTKHTKTKTSPPRKIPPKPSNPPRFSPPSVACDSLFLVTSRVCYRRYRSFCPRGPRKCGFRRRLLLLSIEEVFLAGRVMGIVVEMIGKV
jgi:hypothetical protein